MQLFISFNFFDREALLIYVITFESISYILIQEAMESSAFSNKIIKMKLMKLKVDEYHFCHLKLRKNAASCTCETSGKHPFLFWLLFRGKFINQKKLNVKTLSRPYTKTTHQRDHSKMWHLGIPAWQTHRRGCSTPGRPFRSLFTIKTI